MLLHILTFACFYIFLKKNCIFLFNVKTTEFTCMIATLMTCTTGVAGYAYILQTPDTITISMIYEWINSQCTLMVGVYHLGSRICSLFANTWYHHYFNDLWVNDQPVHVPRASTMFSLESGSLPQNSAGGCYVMWPLYNWTYYYYI